MFGLTFGNLLKVTLGLETTFGQLLELLGNLWKTFASSFPTFGKLSLRGVSR